MLRERGASHRAPRSLPMIRFPKRPIKTDRLDDSDILESEVVEECIATSELQAIALDDADFLLTPASAEPEGVRNVMESLEAEVSRVLGDDRAVLGPRSKVRSAASLAEEVAATPHAPSVRPKSVPVPASVSAPPPASHRSAPPSSSHTLPLGSSPFVVAQHVVVPVSGAVLPASAPSGALPKPEPQIVVVREKPAFAWAVACLALGALGAVVGMRVANGFSKPSPPTVAVTLPQAPAAQLAPQAPSPPSAVLAAPPSPEALLSAATPIEAPPTVVAFDEKDTVHVVATPFVPPQAPVAPAPTAVAPSIPQPAAKPSTSAKPGDPPPLLPDPPPKPLAAPTPPPPPPPPPKPARAKTPEEQHLEAQLKAATK
jgi:hypothetical protein